jgi:NAD(P)-dependent dehydrogenase (short-subunit alcohol dehydrogenase family)
MRLKDRVAIITGGSRGIGKAIALAFAREGAQTAIVGRDLGRAEEVAGQINGSGGRAIGLHADVSIEANVTRMVEQVLSHFRRIDILVNNAGVNLPYRRVVDLTVEEWNYVVGVNLAGPFLCARAVLPSMISQHYGKIINIASVGGRKGAAGRTPYRPTKAAIINFTECLAAEVKEHNIDVNAICPGTVDTDMLREISGGTRGDADSPEQIAAVAVFLACDEGAGVTGTAVDAFGGSNPLFQTRSRVKA